jgi:hypothetical protein
MARVARFRQGGRVAPHGAQRERAVQQAHAADEGRLEPRRGMVGGCLRGWSATEDHGAGARPSQLMRRVGPT